MSGPILRVFEVKTKPGCIETVMNNFSSTSADVVRNEPGNLGYFFSKCVQGGEDVVMFVSVWKDLDAVKARFGDNWQSSFIPEGYDELIEEHFIRHFDANDGWHVSDHLNQ